MTISDNHRTLADFEGNWHLSRQITHASGDRASLEGTASWVRQENGLLYSEVGLLRMGDHPGVEARQSYLWDSDLNVFFSDGRYFHQVPAAGGETAHWCDPDQYDGVYDFTGWPRFTVVWRVRGPRKDYEMRSLYTRA